MAKTMCLFSGTASDDQWQYETTGYPCQDGANRFIMIQVRKQPASENLPCGTFRLYYKKGQQSVRISTLRKCWEDVVQYDSGLHDMGIADLGITLG